MPRVPIVVIFPPEDYAWLRRQVKRRGVKEMDVINEPLAREMPNGVWVPRPMTDQEMGQYLSDLSLKLIHEARLKEM